MPIKPSRFLLSATLACTLAACAPMGGGREGMPGGPGNPPGNQGSGSGAPSVVEQIREQLRDTAQVLNLSPKQAILWEAYQESVSALMADQLKLETYQARHQTALQQIDGKLTTVRNRLTAMEDVAERAAMLYQSLDETQKKTADLRLAATVPPLYSGLSCQGGGNSPSERSGPGSRGGMGNPPGGGMGGGGMGRF